MVGPRLLLRQASRCHPGDPGGAQGPWTYRSPRGRRDRRALCLGGAARVVSKHGFRPRAFHHGFECHGSSLLRRPRLGPSWGSRGQGGRPERPLVRAPPLLRDLSGAHLCLDRRLVCGGHSRQPGTGGADGSPHLPNGSRRLPSACRFGGRAGLRHRPRSHRAVAHHSLRDPGPVPLRTEPPPAGGKRTREESGQGIRRWHCAGLRESRAACGGRPRACGSGHSRLSPLAYWTRPPGDLPEPPSSSCSLSSW